VKILCSALVFAYDVYIYVCICYIRPALAGGVYPDCLGIGPNYSYKIYAALHLLYTLYVTSPTSITAF